MLQALSKCPWYRKVGILQYFQEVHGMHGVMGKWQMNMLASVFEKESLRVTTINNVLVPPQSTVNWELVAFPTKVHSFQHLNKASPDFCAQVAIWTPEKTKSQNSHWMCFRNWSDIYLVFYIFLGNLRHKCRVSTRHTLKIFFLALSWKWTIKSEISETLHAWILNSLFFWCSYSYLYTKIRARLIQMLTKIYFTTP